MGSRPGHDSPKHHDAVFLYTYARVVTVWTVSQDAPTVKGLGGGERELDDAPAAATPWAKDAGTGSSGAQQC
jgi:hypothetical protein